MVLAVHNAERSEVGVPDLVWDDRLEADAVRWAEYLVERGELIHHWEVSGTMKGPGENLWRGSHGAWTPGQMAAAWAAEKQYFRSGVYPDVSSTGSSKAVGHYTQMVWRSTRDIGCGLATDGQMDILVCRYETAGNWRRQRVY